MFQRVITGWAMDALALRRRGLDKPCSRNGAGLALPGREADGGPHKLYAAPHPAITWQARRGRAA
jgi:hypothetical protein